MNAMGCNQRRNGRDNEGAMQLTRSLPPLLSHGRINKVATYRVTDFHLYEVKMV